MRAMTEWHRECPVMVAISGCEHSASASRVTAVPRRSWKCSPEIPALRQAANQYF
jgi:hypothetical protein